MPYSFHHKNSIGQLEAGLHRLRSLIYTPVGQLDVEAWLTPEPMPYDQRKSGRHVELKKGDKWGDIWDCGWFHLTGKLAAEAAGHPVALLIDVNGEACVFNNQGEPVRGLTSGNSYYNYPLGGIGKKVFDLTDCARGGDSIDLWMDCGCNDLFGVYQGQKNPAYIDVRRVDKGHEGRLIQAEIAIFHLDIHELYYDYEVLLDFLHVLPPESARHQKILVALCKADQILIRYDAESVAKAHEALAHEMGRKGGDDPLTISAIGNSHIDLAYLWPLRETIRKGARTFSTVLTLMDRYPDYVFGQSQPQIYQWMKERYPALYERIKARVAEGRWELHGALWVECDTNIPSGESMARQILYGQRFWRAEFGKQSEMVWLPDTFGYSGILPQLMRKAGIRYFMTHKLCWDQYNDYPHHSFHWQGIDGSQVLVHLPPEDTYNSLGAPCSVAKAASEYLDSAFSGHCLLLVGIGDGGGGPGVEHLERLDRVKNMFGLPPVVQEFGESFFHKLDAESGSLPTWAGELYLSMHQGTYTSQARSKRWNRKLEQDLRRLEWSAAAASVLCGFDYPKAAIEKYWKEVLLYQFHDVITGSSITRVFDESLARYAIMDGETRGLAEKAEATLIAQIDSSAARKPLLVSNDLSWPRVEWVEHEGRWLKAEAPAMGYTVLDLEGGAAEHAPLTASEQVLENDCLRVSFNAQGWINSVFDKKLDREMIDGGLANMLTVYDDQGDAWDFPLDYHQRVLGRFELKGQTARVDGPCARLRQERAYGKSTLVQEIVLIAGSRRIDFVTRVDWREDQSMLRVGFPVTVRTDEATCEIQFGAIKRPTHRNTNWEQAKFEVAVQRWADLSQNDCGVALLNDCKYGYKIEGNLLDLNLLRAPDYPGVKADRAVHEFTYALYPHAGDHVSGSVMHAAAELNTPLRLTAMKGGKGKLPSSSSFLSIDVDDVVIDTVKQSEDGNDLIVRLYEAHGRGSIGRLQLGLPVRKAALVDLMEEHPTNLPIREDAVELHFGPYEIHTVRLYI